MNIIKNMGMEFILKEDMWAQINSSIIKKTRYISPGYKYNYRLYTHSSDFEFVRCENFSGDLIDFDMHFSGNNLWTLEVSKVTNKNSKYYKFKTEKGNDISIKVLYKDILPSIKVGDKLTGQVVIFSNDIQNITSEEFVKKIEEKEDNMVTLYGKAWLINCIEFKLGDNILKFLELDIHTENGSITAVIPCDKVKFEISKGCSYFVKINGIISMDIAPFYKLKDKEKQIYNDLVVVNDNIKYEYGFILDYENNKNILIECLMTRDFSRIYRCCSENIKIENVNNEIKVVSNSQLKEIIEENLPTKIDRIEVKHIFLYKDKKYIGCEVINMLQENNVYGSIYFDINENDEIKFIKFFDSSECETIIDYEFFLQNKLAKAMSNNDVNGLKNYISDYCFYRSEYADKCFIGKDNILNHLKSVNENLEDKKSYTYKIELVKNIINENINLPPIYDNKYCMVFYFKNELCYVVFIKFNTENKITNILLSCNEKYLKIFEKKENEKIKINESVKDIISSVYGSKNNIEIMRKDEILNVDNKNLYIWKKADEFICSYLKENNYTIKNTQIFEDCIGYNCSENKEEYAIFLFAFGENKIKDFNGDYCSKVKKYGISKDKKY